MTSLLETLENNYVIFCDQEIPVVLDKDKYLWFHLRTVLGVLKLKDYRETVKNMDPREIKPITAINSTNKPKVQPKTLYVSEPGLYEYVFRSTRETAKLFKNWVLKEVLPELRRYGEYKIKDTVDAQIKGFLEQINNLTEERDHYKNQMVCEKIKYPEGGMIYVIDYSEPGNEIYRIGMTTDLNKRKRVYDTHCLMNRNVVLFKESHEPDRFEMCLQTALMPYRYKANSDFYKCPLNLLEKFVSNCEKTLRSYNKEAKSLQKGGSMALVDNAINLLKKQKTKLVRLSNQISRDIDNTNDY